MTRDPFDEVLGARRGSQREPAASAHPVRWWGFEEEEGTHMDLRRWFDARYEEGLRVMRIEPVPSTFQPDAGPAHQVVLLASHARSRERPLRAAEHAWLLRAWPGALRTRAPFGGLLASPGEVK